MNLLYFSPVAWDSYEQRPHYFVRSFFAAGGDRVDWIDPYPARLPHWRDIGRVDLRTEPLRLARPSGLTVHSARGLPIDPLPAGARINARLFWRALLERLGQSATREQTIIGIGRPTALAREALAALPARWRFYDAMDDFPEFYRGRSRLATATVERDIVQLVDRLVVSSTHLASKFQAAGRPVMLLPNAYEMALLPPFSPQRRADAHLGFIGCLGSWFDWHMALRVADVVAPVPMTLAGPLATRPPRALPANVRLLPPCSQAEGVSRLETFSAGLIPFAISPLTAGVDPIKYYQYRGAGLPVLTTRFGEMALRGRADGVFFLDADAGIEAAVADAAAYQPSAEGIARVRADHDWHARFEGFWTAVGGGLQPAARPAG